VSTWSEGDVARLDKPLRLKLRKRQGRQEMGTNLGCLCDEPGDYSRRKTLADGRTCNYGGGRQIGGGCQGM